MDVFIDPCFDSEYARHPLVLVDAGARGGLKKNWAAAKRHLHLIGFEPDAQEFQRLVERTRAGGRSDQYFNVALHSQKSSLELYVTRDRGLTSIFEPNRAFLDAFPEASRFDVVDRRQIEADTLDRQLERHDLRDVDFVKADTQGSERFVLEGASSILASSVVGVEVEAEFTPIYTGQPLFADVDAFLRGLGFQLFDLRPCYWKRAAGRTVGGPHGQIVWADALYLKSLTTLAGTTARTDPASRKSKWLRAISICLLYGYYDYAIEVAAEAKDIFTAEERATIDGRLRAREGQDGSLPRFPGRRRIAALARRIWRLSRASQEGWSVSDAEIGNLD